MRLPSVVLPHFTDGGQVTTLESHLSLVGSSVLWWGAYARDGGRRTGRDGKRKRKRLTSALTEVGAFPSYSHFSPRATTVRTIKLSLKLPNRRSNYKLDGMPKGFLEPKPKGSGVLVCF